MENSIILIILWIVSGLALIVYGLIPAKKSDDFEKRKKRKKSLLILGIIFLVIAIMEKVW